MLIDRNVVQAALEALEESIDTMRNAYDSDWRHGIPTRQGQLDAMKATVDAHAEAITILKAVLSTGTQEPDIPEWPCECDERGRGEPGVTCGDCPRDYGHKVKAAQAALAAPQPEPVAWPSPWRRSAGSWALRDRHRNHCLLPAPSSRPSSGKGT